MRKIFKSALLMFSLCLLFSTTSYSATVIPNTAGDAVLSVNNLSWTVGPSSYTNWETWNYGPYDVYFDYGSFNNVINVTGVLSVFPNLTEANTAIYQLAAAINAFNAAPGADLLLLDNGESTPVDHAGVPYYPIYTNNVYYKWLFYSDSNTQWMRDDSGLPVVDRDTPITWAVFKPSAVPIPGAMWLLGSGLIGIVGIRRKITK